jgi:hypothetical protein
MVEACHACRFWQIDPHEEIADGGEMNHGWCRREPPQIIEHMARMAIQQPGFGGINIDREDVANAGQVHRATLYPATFATEWCGRFERAEVARG